MSMNIKGSIKRILDTRQVSDKFSVREFDIETTGDKYPQVLRLQVTNDRIAMINGLSVGDEVSIDINLRGREWTGKDGVTKVFNSIDAWKVQRTSAGSVHADPDGAVPSVPQDEIPFVSCSLSDDPSPIARSLR